LKIEKLRRSKHTAPCWCAQFNTKCRLSQSLCWQLKQKNLITTRKYRNSLLIYENTLLQTLFYRSYVVLVIFIAGIWKNFVLISARSFCNTNAHNTDLIHVFIGILWINGVVDPWEKEMDHLIIVQTIIVRNLMRLQAFAQKEMSKFQISL